jgi:cell division protease FtsH
MPAGRNRPRISVETEISLSYADVAGLDEAKEQLREVVASLGDPNAGGKLGGRMPKALLLVGPPGTGKTLLARATAGEAKVAFLPVNGAELIERVIESGAASIRDLFKEAQRRRPALLFIDDLDTLGRREDPSSPAGGLAERERCLNHLLIELDSLDRGAGVAILAATNRPDVLDPALLRSGRFEPLLVPIPDRAARGRILHLHTRMTRMSEDVDLDTLAALTPSFTGADLANLVNQAALRAARRGADGVTALDFAEAAERMLAGIDTTALALNPHEREVAAYHEIGHALVALSLPGSDPVPNISLVPRHAGLAGCSMRRAGEDRFLLVRQELENEMTVLLAGRAAEHLVFGELSTYGAADLQKATAIATDIAARHGMTCELGQVSYRDLTSNSGETGREIDRVVKSLIHRNFSRAVELLRAQREILEQGARLLANHGRLDATELAALRQHLWSRSEGGYEST